MAVAILYYLWGRFPNKFIYKRLNKETCRKAGTSARTLRRWIRRLENADLIRRCAHKRQGFSMHYVLASKKHFMAGGYARYSRWVPHERIKCTVVVDDRMLPRDILRQLERKVFEHLNAQVLYEKQRRHDAGGGETMIKTGEVRKYPQHPSVSLVKSPSNSYYAPMPGDAFSSKMNISKRGFWRLVAHMERAGEVERVRRRVRLPEVEDPAEFRRKWGVGAFRDSGGWWWGQLPNHYFCRVDYRRLETLGNTEK